MPRVQPLPKKPKRPPAARVMRDRATKAWGQYIHLRDEVCRYCGRADGKLDAHHVMVREYSATRTDENNGMLLCFRCHQVMHSDPHIALSLYWSCLGVEGYEALRQKAQAGVGAKYPASFWAAELERLTALREAL